MNSIWLSTASLPPRPTLEGSVKADVAIIGAGMAGILTGWFLKQNGLNPVILEAGRTANGETGYTTAKITVQHGAIYHKLSKAFGGTSAKLYYQSQQEALDEYARIISSHSIACSFHRLPSYLYTCRSSDIISKEAAAAEKIGIKAELTTQTRLPFPAVALKYPDQAQFHPLYFLEAISDSLTIYENSGVLSLKENKDGTVLTVPRGTLTAQYVVFACHYPFINVPGYYFLKMHQERSYVLAIESKEDLDGLYYGVDPGGYSFRPCGSLLLFGGAGHRTGETLKKNRKAGASRSNAELSFQSLENAAKELYPGRRIACRWSAQDCITLDGLPYIGRFSKASPNWFVATGFAKWGMTNSMVSARLISDLIAGRKNPYETLYSPARFTPAASASAFAVQTGHSVKSLSKEIFSVPRGKIADIPNGTARIISCHGEKSGVYKDADGHCFAVSVRCPHLGCELSWNQDDLSWDCPCHGSRFDYTGKLLNTPASADLKNNLTR